jgi:NitT/TauT family transport system ATP-binding protein
MLGPEIQRLDLARSLRRGEELLRRYGLGDFLDHYPHQLSGGMRQRAALARTLVTEPDILLLDEPFSALDYQTRLALADEVGVILRRESKTVILVTHDISEAITMTDRVIVMSRRPGRIRAEHRLSFPSQEGERPSPFKLRKAPEFAGYFDEIWNELDIHVGN